MSRPIVPALFFYAAGIIFGSYITLSFLTLVLFGLAFLLAGLINEAVAWRKNRVYFLLALTIFGVIMFQWQSERNKGNLEVLAGKKSVLIGTVSTEPDIRTNGTNYTVKVEQELSGNLTEDSPGGNVLLAVKGAAKTFSYGDRLEIIGTPEVPGEPGNPGDFNYRKYLQSKGIQLIINSWDGSGVRRTGTGSLNYILDFCFKLRESLVSILNKSLDAKYAPIMEGVLFGSAGRIDYQAQNDFALSGVIHILSVSGYHMALLAGACLVLGNLFGLTRGVLTFITIAVTLFYAIMTGFSPPVARAAVMIWTLLLARLLRRNYDWQSSMSLAAFVILIMNPQSLFNAGFQLSFIATWGIFYLTPIIEPGLDTIPYVGKAASVTLAAQLAVLPVTSYYFSYFSVISVVANLIIVPLVSLAMLTGTCALLGGVVSLTLAEIINISTALVLELVLRLAHLMASLPFSVITTGQPSIPLVISVYVITFIVIETMRSREMYLKAKRFWQLNRSGVIFAALIAAAVFIWTGIFMASGENLEVTFLDIGQGDAAIIRSPEGKIMMIDTGGNEDINSSFKPGEKILVPYLRRQGIHSIDLMLLTHPHADHIQGAESVLKYMSVDMLAVNTQFSQYPEGAALLDKFRQEGSEVKEVVGGDTIGFDDIRIQVLKPSGSATTGENNDSMITRLSYGSFSILFTG
ncbi:MAG TPA: DNA internalization-related competence protein ComEC/Rec2, partial [Desulfobacteria bacterium]|nr:DNA internalization-related competence protein ComEC/Rec2 [Desulfobacteria bacterium]